MEYKPISSVVPMENNQLLVHFTTGNSVRLNMEQHMDTVRYRCLQEEKIWEAVTTDGYFVLWKGADLSYEEVLILVADNYI